MSDHASSIWSSASVSSSSIDTSEIPVADVLSITSTSEISRRASSISAVTSASTRAGSAPG
jgi:hypothetical protein